MIQLRRCAAALVLIIGAALLVVAPAEASAPAGAPARDTVTVTGYNFEVNREADVVVGSPDAALRITYTAGKALTDGMVRVVLPRQQWPTTLRTVPYFSGSSPFSEYDRAGVSVLPAEARPIPRPACAGRGGAGVFLPADWSVASYPSSQIITVAHATCAAGARLVVRIKGITAPSRVGPSYLPVSVSQSGGAPRLSAGAVAVVPVPQVRLIVTVPDPVVAGSFSVIVFPIGPDGGPIEYDGAVAVAPEPEDCTFFPHGDVIAAQFAGTSYPAEITVSLNSLTARFIHAFDVANKAVPGVSRELHILDEVPDPTCPASFH